MSTDVFNDGVLNEPASQEQIDRAIEELGFALPAGHVEWLLRHNGGEGFVGENYLILWRAEELAPFNRDYEVATYAPDILLFGSTGGGEAFGYDRRDPRLPVVIIPLIGMDREVATFVADSFDDLFEHLRLDDFLG